MQEIRVESELNADIELLSVELLNMRGVNYELSPIVKMTTPRQWAEVSLSEWPVGRKLFKSTILLFGFVPIDLHYFELNKSDRHGFEECSTSLMNRKWMHHRRLSSINGKTTVVDVVSYDSKIGALEGVFKRVYQIVFKHRHKRLVKKYGTSS